MVWCSYNGSAWRRGFQVLHTRVYRNTALNTPTTQSKLPYDTVDEDTFGMWNMANNQFVVPIFGWYSLKATYVAATGNNGWVTCSAYKNGTLHSQGGGTQTSQATNSYAVLGATIHCTAAGDTVAVYFNSNVASAVATGSATCYCTMDYMGSGG